MKAADLLSQTNLFSSRSDMQRAFKAGEIKINRVPIDSLDEEIEQGDFLNFIWLPCAKELLKEHGKNLLLVNRGKKKAVLVQVNGDDVSILEGT